MASATGNDFTFTTSGEYSTNHYSGGETNLSYGFKITRGSGKSVIIQFGLRNYNAGGGTFTYSWATDRENNHVTVNSTKILLGSSHDGRYSYSGIGDFWSDCAGMTWTITLSNGGNSGSDAINIAYSMEMNNSCYSGGASGVLKIPQGFIPSTEYITSCSAPTTVSINNTGIQAPSSSITISWSGASAGNNNAINGYTIYWRATSGGSSPTTSAYTGSADVSSSVSSYSLSLASFTRGYIVKVGVVTRGTAGASYYSNIKVSSSQVQINRLPTAPTLATSTVYFSNSGGTVSTTLTAGNVGGDTGQTYSMWYATSASGEKHSTGTNFTSPSINSDTTYYFWGSDGLEFSGSYVTLSAKKNTIEPEITGVSANLVEKASSLLSSGQRYMPRITSLTYNFTKSTYGTAISNTGALTVALCYRVRGSNSSTVFNETVISDYVPVGNVTSYTISNIDIISKIGNNKEWYVKAFLQDGIDTSENYRYPSGTSLYYTAPVPIFQGFFNRKNTSDIANFSNYFYQDGRVQLSYDSNYSNISLEFAEEIGSTSTTITDFSFRPSPLSETRYRFADLTITYKSTYAGHTLKLKTIILNDGYNTLTLIPNATKTFIYLPTLENLVGFNTYKPYTNTASTTNISVGVRNLTNSNKATYGLSNLTDIKFQMKYNSTYYDISSKCSGYSISSSTLSAALTLTDLYSPADNQLNFPNIYSSYQYQFVAKVTNVFGYTTETAINQTIDFREVPQITNTSLKVNGTNIGVSSVVLQENMIVAYSFKNESYNQGQVTYALQYSLNGTNWTNIKTGSVTFSANSSTSIMTSTVITGTWTAPQLSNTGTVTFRVYSTNNLTSQSSSPTTITTSRSKILPATSIISAAKNDGDIIITISSDTRSNNTSLISNGNVTYENSYLTQIYADISSNPTTRIGDPVSGNDLPSTLSFTSSENFLNIKIITTRTITQKYSGTTVATTTQIITSNIYSYYGTISTIQYRKNHIGINNAYAFTSTDAVVIAAVDSARRVIRFIGEGNQAVATLTLPATGGSDFIMNNFTITSGALNSSTVSDCIIDGGSW